MDRLASILVSAGVVTLIVGVGMAFNIPQTIAQHVGGMIPDNMKLGGPIQYPANAPAKSA